MRLKSWSKTFTDSSRIKITFPASSKTLNISNSPPIPSRKNFLIKTSGALQSHVAIMHPITIPPIWTKAIASAVPGENHYCPITKIKITCNNPTSTPR
jgi:hypothetical protein